MFLATEATMVLLLPVVLVADDRLRSLVEFASGKKAAAAAVVVVVVVEVVVFLVVVDGGGGGTAKVEAEWC